MKYKLEYVWLDGYKPEPNLRSKVRITGKEINGLQDIPEWGFDGSSTKQAEGYSSDCYLKPVRIYRKDGKQNSDTIYVLCEVMDSEGNPHNTNDRAKLDEDFNFWVGFEQEYFIRNGHNKNILGFHTGGVIDPQGVYYCGVGGQMYGRNLSEEHLDMCLNYNIGIEGTNAEVAIGQWEYQVFAKGKLKSADDLWMSRYFLYKIAEKYGYEIELHPKPLTSGDWNGSGLHTNFSNERMREQGGEEYFKSIFQVFESRADIHIQNYGSDNHLRLTGKHETQSINKFSWGVSDRGASIRAPKVVGETWKGYLEDRRPASNGNPYSILRVISDSLDLAEDLDEVHTLMNKNIDISSWNGKYKGMLSNEELLKEYRED
jgi:glutamine synthetase